MKGAGGGALPLSKLRPFLAPFFRVLDVLVYGDLRRRYGWW